MDKKRVLDLQNRLTAFAVRIVTVVEALPDSRTGRHVAGQLVRAGTAPAANYGEAQSAESRRDFIHKIRLALKELRETMVWLRIIEQASMCDAARMGPIVGECSELIAILVASVNTARARGQNREQP